MGRFILRGVLLPVLLLAACSKDRMPSVPAASETGTSVTLDLLMQLPSQASSTYQTVGTEQENYIHSIYLLAFRVDDSDPGDVKEYFDYKAMGSNIRDVLNTTNKKQFSVTVFKRSYKQRFVVIANAHKQAGPIDESYEGRLKEDMLEELVFENGEPWHATSSAEFVYLPMWGESEVYTINDSFNQVDEINMLRAVSRIDVSLATTEAQDDFTLTDVYLYNRHTDGTVVPDTDPATWDGTDYKVLRTTMPYGVGVKTRGPLMIPAETPSGGTPYIPSIYTFETTAPESDLASGATAVVVGGYYKNDASPSYYRVDFQTKDDQGNVTGYKELLRNHLYRLNIEEVLGSGHGTPDEAFDAKTQDIVVTIVEWNQGDMTEVIFDGQYMLGVSESIYYVPKPADEYELTVTTDYPDGWTGSVDALYPWLEIVHNASGSPDVKTTMAFSVDENTGDTARIGWIDITAGRLTHRIKVIQDVKNALSLQVLDHTDDPVSELRFLSYAGESADAVPAQIYKVKWEPASETVNVVPGSESPAFDFTYQDNPTSFSTLTATGSESYTIQPRAFTEQEVDETDGDPFLEKNTTLHYYLGTGVEMISQTILLKQIHYNLLAKPEATYPGDGGVYSFKVRSNCNWTAAVTDNSGSPIVANITTTSGSVNKNPGTDFYFTTIDDAEQSGWIDVTFTYTSEDGLFTATKTVRINVSSNPPARRRNGANSYFIRPNADEGYDIPADWANGDGVDRIFDGETYTAELLWTDHPKGMAPDAALSNIIVQGTGTDTRLLIYPGSDYGNAVIALRGPDNTIRWSWHLWVTNYDPDNATDNPSNGGFTFMKLPMGALNDVHGTTDNLGLYYQWGRKDPFPGAGGIQANAFRTIYDAEGKVTSIEKLNASALEACNLEPSILHPKSFIVAFSQTQDWYANNYEGINKFLWSDDVGIDGKKVHYDPCPEGWKVPTATSSAGPWYGIWSARVFDATTRVTTWDVTGDWQNAGRINMNTGDLEYVGDHGYYWTGSINTTSSVDALSLYLDGTAWGGGLTPVARGHAYNVRCVYDNY